VKTAQHVDVLEVRRTLEVGAARLAAVRRTPDDIATLKDLLARRVTARHEGDVDAIVAMDVQLHRAIAQASHNPVLADLYDNLIGALQENVRRNVEELAPHDDEDHSKLIEAIILGNPESAAEEAALFLDALLVGANSSLGDNCG
jgi:DNA-binding FadR family transcriptional regulator